MVVIKDDLVSPQKIFVVNFFLFGSKNIYTRR